MLFLHDLGLLETKGWRRTWLDCAPLLQPCSWTAYDTASGTRRTTVMCWEKFATSQSPLSTAVAKHISRPGFGCKVQLNAWWSCVCFDWRRHDGQDTSVWNRRKPYQVIFLLYNPVVTFIRCCWCSYAMAYWICLRWPSIGESRPSCLQFIAQCN